jgi:hypothetical protein
VKLGCASELTVILGWYPGDRSARILRAVTGEGRGLDVARLERAFDLSLLRSGTQYAVEGLRQVARWGHFAESSYPWERVEGL